MNRRNEFVVGLTVLAAVAAIVAGAIFLSDTSVGRREVLLTARFRSVGRLQPGAPAILRGVKIGSVQALRLADNAWVEVDFTVDRQAELPDQPAVIAVSASLFGEWQAAIVGRNEVTDPQLLTQLAEASRGAGDLLPGADLPDIGELTAQASRIASDVGLITDRVQGAIDSSVIADLQASVHDLRLMADRLNQFAETETGTMGRITRNADSLATTARVAAERVSTTFGRVEEATRDGAVQDIIGSTRRATGNLDTITADVRAFTAAVRESEASVTRILATLDSVMIRIQAGRGTIGLLSADSTLYTNTAAAISELRTLIADIRENPRKYFRFSVF